MKVGFCVEGSTDECLLQGLRDRWCPGAELVKGRYRSFKRKQTPKVCLELRTKGVDLIILIRDANNEDWRDVAQADLAACKPEDAHLVVVGVCDRNVECWLVANRQYAAGQTGKQEADFEVDDPKEVFNRAMGISRVDSKSEEIVSYIRGAPLRTWLANKSFEALYDQLWQKSKHFGCTIENLRESGQG